MISDVHISCNHTATKGPHCHFNVTTRAGRVPFKEVFKGLKTIWSMKGFSAFANQLTLYVTESSLFKTKRYTQHFMFSSHC
jgi:hypothetical protein